MRRVIYKCDCCQKDIFDAQEAAHFFSGVGEGLTAWKTMQSIPQDFCIDCFTYIMQMIAKAMLDLQGQTDETSE